MGISETQMNALIAVDESPEAQAVCGHILQNFEYQRTGSSIALLVHDAVSTVSRHIPSAEHDLRNNLGTWVAVLCGDDHVAHEEALVYMLRNRLTSYRGK